MTPPSNDRDARRAPLPGREAKHAFRVVAIAMACVGALTLVSGCSGAEPSAHATASVALRESTIYPGAYQLPSERIFGQDPATTQAVDARVEQLIAACMAERGFSYTPKASSAGSRASMQMYGAVDKEWASIYAYLTPYDVEELANPGPVDDPNAPPVDMRAAPTDEENALMGVDPVTVARSSETGRVVKRYHADGCLWQAILAVQPDYFRQAELRAQLDDVWRGADRSVPQTAEYEAAKSKWITCMAGHGYEVSGPVASQSSANEETKIDTTQVTAETIAMALQDIDCKNSTGFLREWSKLLAEAENALLVKHPGLIEELSSLNDADYQRVAGGGQ